MNRLDIERIIRVDRTVIEVYVGRNLHIFDRDQDGTRTVTNAISKEYVENVLSWLGDYPYEKIYLYHTDGMITQWDAERGFKRAKKENPELYYPFVERCLVRRKQFQFVH